MYSLKLFGNEVFCIQMNEILYSLVIPCFNEESNVEQLVKHCRDLVARPGYEVVLVDNGSADSTRARLLSDCADEPRLQVVTSDLNLGYGGGIKLGLSKCSGDIVGWTHADLQTDVLDFARACDHLKKNEGIDVVKGRRKNRRLNDYFFTLGMSIFETILLRTWLTDINGQPTVYRKAHFGRLDDFVDDFSFDLEFYYEAKRRKKSVTRIDVFFPRRLGGISSWNHGIRSKLQFIARTVKFSIKLAGSKRR